MSREEEREREPDVAEISNTPPSSSRLYTTAPLVAGVGGREGKREGEGREGGRERKKETERERKEREERERA